MYRCIICKKQSERGEAQSKLYTYRKNINSEGYEKGFDIISEKIVCKNCYDNENNKHRKKGDEEVKPKPEPKEKPQKDKPNTKTKPKATKPKVKTVV